MKRAKLEKITSTTTDEVLDDVRHLHIFSPLLSESGPPYAPPPDQLGRFYTRLHKIHTLTAQILGNGTEEVTCVLSADLLALIPSLRRLEVVGLTRFPELELHRPRSPSPSSLPAALRIKSLDIDHPEICLEDLKHLLPSLHNIEALELSDLKAVRTFETILRRLPSLQHLRRLALVSSSWKDIPLQQVPALASLLPTLEHLDIGGGIGCSAPCLANLVETTSLTHLTIGANAQIQLFEPLLDHLGAPGKHLQRLTLNTLRPVKRGKTADEAGFEVRSLDESWRSPFHDTQRREYDALLARAEAAGVEVDGTDIAVLEQEDDYLAERERLLAACRRTAAKCGIGPVLEMPLDPRRERM
ncbi:hypothetical protein JCM10207_004320 [Rhodosporidiobolus poonsookiae]